MVFSLLRVDHVVGLMWYHCGVGPYNYAVTQGCGRVCPISIAVLSLVGFIAPFSQLVRRHRKGHPRVSRSGFRNYGKFLAKSSRIRS